MRIALKLEQDVYHLKVRIVSDSMSTLQRIQNLHPSQQVANSDEIEILEALALPTEGGCNLSFTWCPCHHGVRSNELADEATKEGTTVEQEEENIIKSAKSAIWQAIKEPPINHERLRRIYSKRVWEKLTTSWKEGRCQGRTRFPSAD